MNEEVSTQTTTIFFNEDGYIEMIFVGIVSASELQQLLGELNRLVEQYGPVGLLLDGRNGRVSYDAGTLIAFAETKISPQLTHMAILTHTSNTRRDVIKKKPKGIVTQVSAKTFGVPQTYLCHEGEARRLAANQNSPPNCLGQSH